MYLAILAYPLLPMTVPSTEIYGAENDQALKALEMMKVLYVVTRLLEIYWEMLFLKIFWTA